MPKIPFVARPRKANPKNIPWYTTKLEADKVWLELGFAGQGTLNVIHDKNFIPGDHLQRSIYRNPKGIAGNGKDDDGNGFVDDVHGYNSDLQSSQLLTRTFTGNPKDRKTLHGTNCANIVSGSGDGKDRPAFGIAPLSQWASVINLGGIEQSVEWAIEQGADTYSMSFTRTPFSCIGPVTWATEHYRDGTLQKPEVCAFNAKVVSQFPNGKIVPGLLNGNSYAGPMFCGAISLMLSADPDLLPWDLKEIITDTATDVGPEGIDPQTGHGLINCYKAVKEVQQRKQLRK